MSIFISITDFPIFALLNVGLPLKEREQCRELKTIFTVAAGFSLLFQSRHVSLVGVRVVSSTTIHRHLDPSGRFYIGAWNPALSAAYSLKLGLFQRKSSSSHCEYWQWQKKDFHILVKIELSYLHLACRIMCMVCASLELIQ